MLPCKWHITTLISRTDTFSAETASQKQELQLLQREHVVYNEKKARLDEKRESFKTKLTLLKEEDGMLTTRKSELKSSLKGLETDIKNKRSELQEAEKERRRLG